MLIITLVPSVKGQVVNLATKAGVSYAKIISGRYADEKRYKPGVSFGLSSDYKLSERKFINLELLFTQKGSTNIYSDMSNQNPTNEYNFSFYYLGPSVSFKKFTDKKNKFFFDAGFFTEYLIKGTLRHKVTDDFSPAFVSKENINLNDYNRLDFGLQTGLGYKIKLTHISSLIMDIRFNPSFSTLYGKWYSDLEPRNATFIFNIEYEFGINGEN